MHLPDGFLDAKTALTAGVLSVAGIGLALRQVRRDLPPRRVPLLGLGAAFVFAAQMVNFPIVSGTSGHLVGGTLIGVLLGVPAAVIVMTTVLVAQCLLFADGGVTVLGANILNMGLLAPWVGAAVYRALVRGLPGRRGQVAAIAFGAWCSMLASAVACAGQLAWSGTVAWRAAWPAMTAIHALIGLGEGAITALVFAAVARTRPELVEAGPGAPGGRLLGHGLLAAVALAVFAAPFACPWPDGLESVAERLGFSTQAGAAAPAPLADYLLPGLGDSRWAVAGAGLAGVVVVFGAAWLLSRVIVRRQEPAEARR